MKFARKLKGVVVVEMVLVLPVLLMLMVAVIDLSRAIQANNILVNISREGANIASRSGETPQDVMSALSLTSDPLDLEADGMMYVTVVTGQEDAPPVVIEQYRWTDGGLPVASRTWAGCGVWGGDGECLSTDVRPPLGGFPIDLADGETVYSVEVFYEYSSISYVLGDTLPLYSNVYL